MNLGLMTPLTDYSIRPDHLAIAAEERGFSSLWLSEHTHIPISSATSYPMGGAIPETLKQVLDPFVALAAAAAVTDRIELATGVALIAQRDPIITAKEISSIDYLSGGRMKVGVGFGWNRDEAAHHGIDPSERWDIVREKVLAMKQLWTNDEAEFDGKHVRFSPSWQWPKPVQQPPIYLGGGATTKNFDRIIDYCEGWMPLGGADVVQGISELRTRAERRGRDPESIDVIPVVFGVAPDNTSELDALGELGISTVIVGTMGTMRDSEAIALLDQLQPLIDS